MRILESYEMIELAELIKNKHYQEILATNLKKYRLKFYNMYAELKEGVDNPYSLDNIASLLGISKRHYLRLENPKNITKNITLDKLLLLSKVYYINLQDFFDEDNNNL